MRRLVSVLVAVLLVPLILMSDPAVASQGPATDDTEITATPTEQLLDGPQDGPEAIRELGDQLDHSASKAPVGRSVASSGDVRRAVKGAHYAKVVPACGARGDRHSNTCFALRRVKATASTPGAKRYVVPASYPVGPAAGYTPSDLWAAYGLGTPTSLTAAGGPGTGQTIGIVDAYDAPTIEADLAAFDAEYNLPACTSLNGCFKKVGQTGSTSSLPPPAGTDPGSAGWAQETSLDVEAAHAVCPNCKILLVESNDSLSNNMGAAVNEAAALGATVITNSYGGAEFSDSTNQSSYVHGSAVITASAGDDGYFNYQSSTQQHRANTPAAYPSVVAVGGTALKLDHVGARASEEVWNDKDGPNSHPGGTGGTGGGCSALFAANVFQSTAPGYSNASCGTGRLLNDVSAVGDPYTGFDVYDSFAPAGGAAPGWQTVGGTSLSSPVVAAMFALAGGNQGIIPARTLYSNLVDNPAAIYDVTVGGNGSCGGASCSGQPAAQDCNGTTGCDAAVGLDGPSGIGAPVGVADLNPVIAHFGAPATADENVEVTADASASTATATGSPITDYHWDWGDGTSPTTTATATTTHTYSDAGRYTITLTASTTTPNPATSVPTSRSILIGHPEPALQTAPTVTGTATDLRTLTEHSASWTHSPTSFTYGWKRCDNAGANCTTIPNATAQTYRLLDADVGHTIEAIETASNASASSTPAESVPSAVVAALPPPATAAYASVGTPVGTGANPQGLAISPSGHVMAVANQGDSTVSMFTVDSGGALTTVTGSPFAAGSPAFLAFSPDGKFLAVSDPNDSALEMFAVASNGVLAPVPGSPFHFYSNTWNVAPSQLAFSPDGSTLVTTTTHGPSERNVVVYSIGATGVPTPTSGSPIANAIAMPTSVSFSPSGEFLAVTSKSTNKVQILTVNSDETFTPTAGSPYTVGTSPLQATFSPGGGLLAVPYSGALSMYTVSSSGALTQAAGSPITPAAPPTNAFFSPAGGLLAVPIGQSASAKTAVYSYAADGSLTALTGSPYACQEDFCFYGAGAFSPDGSLLAVPNYAMSTVEVFAQGSAPTVPSAPTDVVATPGHGQATVSWTAAADHGSAITGYTVTSSPDAMTCSTQGATQCTVPGLTNGTAYTFTVIATNGVGTSQASDASNSVTPTATVPGAPTGVTATPGDSQVTVSWTAPATTGGSAITGYTVTSSPESKTCTPASGATQCIVTGLTNGTFYSFSVVATNDVGPGPASDPSQPTAPTAGATVPSAPTNVTATAGDGQAVVSWTAATVVNGPAVTGYTVTARVGGVVVRNMASGGSSTSATMTMLTNGTTYTFTVTATNPVGDSPASTPSAAVTPLAPAVTPPAVTPPAGPDPACVAARANLAVANAAVLQAQSKLAAAHKKLKAAKKAPLNVRAAKVKKAKAKAKAAKKKLKAAQAAASAAQGSVSGAC
jgi:6-phosphogluconolactonase (cycloisomerase 2 family)